MARKRKTPLTFDRLMAIERVAQPVISPDGTRVAFVTTSCDPAENKTLQTIRLLDVASGEIRELTPGPGKHFDPAWSPDGRKIAFVSSREDDLGPQLWILPMDGGEARRVTSGYGGVSGPLWAPDSRRVALVREVVVSPDYSPKNKDDVDPRTGPSRAAVHGLINPKSSARVADALLFRHWDVWRDRRRKHLFVVDVRSGRLADVTPHDCDAPPISLGSERDYDFSPDGRTLAFVMNPDAVVARSTNNSVFLQGLRGVRPVGDPVCISDSEACDSHPRFTGDGRCVVYLAMRTPGFEADRQRLKIHALEAGTTRVLLEPFDRSPHAFALDGKGGAFLLAEDRGRVSVYHLRLDSGEPRQLTCGSFNGSLRVFPDGERLLVTRETSRDPADLYLVQPGEGIAPYTRAGPLPTRIPPDAGATVRRLTHYGDAVSDAAMNPAEEFWYPGAGSTRIHGFLVRPPKFREGRRYPLIFLIHGGPQGAWADHFHYRWSVQMFAAQGAVVACVNPRGSTGYGQRLTDEISRDWGGRCYRDLMLGLDHLLEAYPFIDGERIAAAGASFGGFMVNWILGHTDRFRALVCHDGIFNAETMAYSTEELWFEEHEHGGMPHDDRKDYLKFSPHRFVDRFCTPTLVIHGENDFRCPISEGLGLFTALQVKGVESRLLHFPDEGHWVMQPANAEVWYHEVVGWLMRFLK